MPEYCTAIGNHARPETGVCFQFLLPLVAGIFVDIVLHCRSENDTCETIFSTQFLEHLEVLYGGSTKSDIKNEVRIDDTSQLNLIFVYLAKPICDFA